MEEPCAIYVGRKFNVGGSKCDFHFLIFLPSFLHCLSMNVLFLLHFAAIGRVVVRFRRRRIGGRRGERREEKSKGMKKLKVEFGCIC